MITGLSTISHESHLFFKTIFSRELTILQKRVLGVALLALGILAACLTAIHFCAKRHKNKVDANSKEAKVPAKKEDDIFLDDDIDVNIFLDLLDDKVKIRVEGELKDGKLHGKGKITFGLGKVHEGQFKEGLLNGEGKITFKEMVIKGEFKNGCLNGQGTMTLKGKPFWEGEFKDGILNGRGKSVTKSIIEEGIFLDGKLNGPGKKRFKDGTVYEGKFKAGNLHDREGKATYKNGTVCSGEFKDGKFTGQGKQIFSNKIIYEGDFVAGVLNGKGKKTYPGTLSYPKGYCEEGIFKNGDLEGQGKITHYDKQIEEGEFKAGKLVKSLHLQIKTAKKQLKLSDVPIPKYVNLKLFGKILNDFGPTSAGITESYVWKMRKWIFGFSIGQKKSPEELRKPNNIDLGDLKNMLEGGNVGPNLLFVASHLEQLIRKKTEQGKSDFLEDLKRLQSVVKRSLPFAFTSYLNTAESNITNLAKDLSQELKQMKPNEHLLFPIGSPTHATLLLLQKNKNNMVTATHYNTGLGVDYHLTSGLSLKAMTDQFNYIFKNQYPISKAYPSINIESQQNKFETLIIKLLKLKEKTKEKKIETDSGNHAHIGKIDKNLEKHLGKGLSGPSKPVQKSGVCGYQVLTAAFKDILGSKLSYNSYKIDFLTYIQKEFQEITDAMKSLVDRDDQIKKLYPLHELLLKENQAQIDATQKILDKIK